MTQQQNSYARALGRRGDRITSEPNTADNGLKTQSAGRQSEFEVSDRARVSAGWPGRSTRNRQGRLPAA